MAIPSESIPIPFHPNPFYNPAYNHTQDNHLDNIIGIRTRAIELVNVFEMEFRWEKDKSFTF